MHLVVAVIGAGWIFFWIYWIAASIRVKPGRARWTGGLAIRVVLVLVVLLLVRRGTFHGQTVTGDRWQQGIGLVVFASGLALALWARLYLGRNWGTPMSEKVDPDLVTTGPYRRVRHPIYSGIILAMLGTAVAVNLYLLVVVGLIGTYFVYSAVMEERYMTERFPDRYPAYQRSTKMLVPFVL